MTINNWLSQSTKELAQAQVPNPRLDLLIMLEKVIKKSRALLLANDNQKLTASQQTQLNSMLKQRLLRKPLAYIVKEKEFYGRSFTVNKDVLIPRPESEDFIVLLTKYWQNKKNLLDIGTGSGCLAISAKLEQPSLDVYASDISQKALRVAQQNALKLNATIKFLKADLVPKTSLKFNIIFANLPYIPKKMDLAQELSYEPSVALFANNDGLLQINRLISQLPSNLTNNGLFFCESMQYQHGAVATQAQRFNLKLVTTKGLVQLFELIN